MKIRPSAALGALALMLSVSANPVFAAEGPREIQGLLHQGKAAEALSLANRVIDRQPREAEVRLLKGVALAELGRQDEAIAVFVKLTQDFPAQPEPYNNLAVLYARQKQYDKARTALESAIRTHPSYAVAHRNLGDVYARLASQAYEKALQPDGGRGAEPPARLALITEMTAGGSSRPAQTATTPVAASSPPAAPAPAAPAVIAAVAAVAPPPTPQTAPPVVAPKPPTPAAVIAPADPPTTPAREASPPAAEPKTAAKPAADTARLESGVLRAVESWAQAWSRKDVKGYLAAYDKDFEVPDGRSRVAWERERQQRVGKPGSISVEVETPRVTLNGDRAIVRFQQRYRSSGFNASTVKTLELVRRGDDWRIRREQAGG